MNLCQLVKLFMLLLLFPAHDALQPFFGQIQHKEKKTPEVIEKLSSTDY